MSYISSKTINPTQKNILVTRTNPRSQLIFNAPSQGSVQIPLTIIDRTDNRATDVHLEVNYFTTGLIFELPPNCFLNLSGSPDLLHYGYTLVSPLIVDASSNGNELIVGLLKFKNTDDIETPFNGISYVACTTPLIGVQLNHGESQQQYQQQIPQLAPSSSSSKRLPQKPNSAQALW